MLRRISTKATTADCLIRRTPRRRQSRVLVSNTSHPNITIGSSRRSYAAAATSREKRALNAQQLKGEKIQRGGGKSTAASGAPIAPVAESSSGGAGVGTALALLAIAGGGAAAAYYNDLLPYFNRAAANITEEELKRPGGDDTTSTQTAKTTDNEDTVSEILPAKESEELKEIIAGAITDESVGEAVGTIAKEEGTVAGPSVAEADLSQNHGDTATVEEKNTVRSETTVPKSSNAIEGSSNEILSAASVAASPLDESKIMAEIEKLKNELHKRSDEALTEAHAELAKLSSLDVMSQELDSMTNSQLKVRLVQMAKDLEERTKWEAVRLQEFLSMKEKEVEDRYVLLIKKLRLEAEHLQEEKLAQQKKVLVGQAEEALKEQQTRSDAFLENSLQIQEKAHEEDKVAFEKKTEEAMSAKYEELFGNELTKIKDEFSAKMNQRVQQMEQLSKKLSDLESSLKTSQDFQVGSLQAHRITAAAIALTEKLESGEPAGAAVNALKAVASDNAVVSAAVQSLPLSVSNSGISTVQELQTRFEQKVYPQCRRAANVPKGQNGLEGQLLGSIFTALRSPPGPDEAAPETEKDAAEFVLSRARQHVQLGELDKAVIELDKLKGQVAYTAKDWECSAKDRVAVEKAMKVIRLECALANENLSKGNIGVAME